MPRHLSALGATLALVAAGSAAAQGQSFKAEFLDQNGKTTGTAELTQTPHGVLVEVDITGLPPGEHGFHLHETGTCAPDTGFESAGGHYGPGGQAHGFLVAEGPHAGDMPNQFVGADGRLRAQALLHEVTFSGGEAPIFDADGSALVVHTKADDDESQPSGEAGDRLACAVLERQ